MVDKIRISAGKLRQALKIQSVVHATDAHGGFSGVTNDTWTTDDEIPAQVSPISDGERLQHAQQESIVTHRVTIRFYPNLTSANRFLFGTKILNIISIRNIGERDVVMEVLCKEKRN